MRYQRENRIVWLYLAAALAVLAAYTKLTALFIVLMYFIVLLHSQRANLFRNKHSYIIALLAIVGLVPLAVLTLKFGQANMQSVSGISDSEVSAPAWRAGFGMPSRCPPSWAGRRCWRRCWVLALWRWGGTGSGSICR